MKEKPNLGRVINVPDKSQLWERINEAVFKLLLGHFLICGPEWRTIAIHQLKELLKRMEATLPDFSNYKELSGSEQITLNAEASFCFILWDMYGSCDYVAFEYAHGHLSRWSDVNGNFVDKYDYWSATYKVLNGDVIPAIHKWIKEVEASDPKWMDSEEGFSYPIFNWHEERQTTVFASAKWRLPNLV